MTGRMLDETLGKWHFWLFFIGFHLTFDTMHFAGMLGMPRPIYTYEPDRGWNTLNFIVSIGGFIQAIAVLIFAWNLIDSYFHGEEAGNDPMGRVDTRVVHALAAARLQLRRRSGRRSRRPLWDLKHPEDPDSGFENTSDDSHGYSIPHHSPNRQLAPAFARPRGHVSRLIIGESAIFTIFVVAYLYYIGRDVHGPTPQSSRSPHLQHRLPALRAASPSGSPSTPSSTAA